MWKGISVWAQKYLGILIERNVPGKSKVQLPPTGLLRRTSAGSYRAILSEEGQITKSTRFWPLSTDVNVFKKLL